MVNNECRIIYIHQPGPVAKNATSRPSGWELNPRPWMLTATASVAQSVRALV